MRLLAALIAVVLTAAAQPSTGQVTVLAVDPSGAPTPGTTVTLRSKDGDRSSVAGQVGRVYMFRVIDVRVDLRWRKLPPGFLDGMTVDAFYQILTRF